MPTVNPSAFGPKPAWFDAAGNPDVSFKLFIYAAGSTSTKQNSYTNSTGSVANTNPIILNALGQTPNELWWDASLLYKVVLAPATDTDPPTNPVWTVDNLQGMNSGGGSTSLNEWILYSASAIAFVNANTFTLVGNQTLVFHIGRRLQFMTSAGFVYGRITNSVFSSTTTVTVQMDGIQVLDSSLSAVYYSILTNDVLALPERIASTTGTNTYTASVGMTRQVLGDEYKLNFAIANDGTVAPSLNLDGLGIRPLLLQNGIVPSSGQINGEHKVRDTSAGFIVLNPIIFPTKGALFGFTLSPAGGSAIMPISQGQATDSTGSITIASLSAYTKTTSAWSVGTGNGGLDTGTIAINTFYYWFSIQRPDNGISDFITSQSHGVSSIVTISIATPGVISWAAHGLQAGAGLIFSTTGALPTGITSGVRYYVIATGLTTDTFQFSTTQGGAAVNTSGTQSGVQTANATPLLPANYTRYRYIGANKTDGSSQWSKVTQDGDDFWWSTPVLDFNSAGSTTATLLTMSVPGGRKMKTYLNIHASVGSGLQTYISDPSNTDSAPSGTAAPLSTMDIAANTGAMVTGISTNTSAQLRHRESSTNTFVIATLGWVDSRGRNS